MRVKILATVNCIGLDPGRQAEVDLDAKVRALINVGFLQVLRPVDGQVVSQ